MTDAEPLVLVVDDYADAREMYGAWLEVSGYRVAFAASGTEALALARTLDPSAILMDLSLPGLDGLEATRLLKADAATRHIAVLALSGQVGANMAQAACEAGCDGFILKPGPVQQVLGELARLVGPRAPTPEPEAGRP